MGFQAGMYRIRNVRTKNHATVLEANGDVVASDGVNRAGEIWLISESSSHGERFTMRNHKFGTYASCVHRPPGVGEYVCGRDDTVPRPWIIKEDNTAKCVIGASDAQLYWCFKTDEARSEVKLEAGPPNDSSLWIFEPTDVDGTEIDACVRPPIRGPTRRMDPPISSDLEKVFNEIPYVNDAAYNSASRDFQPTCLEGTRESLLRAVDDWIHGPSTPPIFWLSGFAGTGKSTIARSVARQCSALGNLGASFFFSRDMRELRKTALLFPTIAVHLGSTYPTLKVAIANALKSDKTLISLDSETKFQKLIVEPVNITKDTLPSSIVVVMDALDECEQIDVISRIIRLLVDGLDGHSLPLKFLLTSRPEPDLRFAFSSPAISPKAQNVVLHDIDKFVVNADIAQFLRFEMEAIALRNRDFIKPNTWPPEKDITALVERADGLFVYASTVVKFLHDGRYRAPKRLAMVLGAAGPIVHPRGNPFAGLDELYHTILQSVIAAEPDPGASDEVSHSFRMVVGSIMLLAERFSCRDLAHLLDMDEIDVRGTLSNLHSLIVVPKGNKVVQAFHPSFYDYITNNTRCTDSRFFLDPGQHHAKIASACLRRLMEFMGEVVSEDDSDSDSDDRSDDDSDDRSDGDSGDRSDDHSDQRSDDHSDQRSDDRSAHRSYDRSIVWIGRNKHHARSDNHSDHRSDDHSDQRSDDHSDHRSYDRSVVWVGRNKYYARHWVTHVAEASKSDELDELLRTFESKSVDDWATKSLRQFRWSHDVVQAVIDVANRLPDEHRKSGFLVGLALKCDLSWDRMHGLLDFLQNLHKGDMHVGGGHHTATVINIAKSILWYGCWRSRSGGNCLEEQVQCLLEARDAIRSSQTNEQDLRAISGDGHESPIESSKSIKGIENCLLEALGEAYHTWFQSSQNRDHIDKSIQYYQEAIGGVIECGKREVLWSLGISYRDRYKQFKNKQDIDDSVRCYQQMLATIDGGKHRRALEALAAAYRLRFKSCGNTADIDEYIRCHQQIVVEANDDDRLDALEHLGAAYRRRFKSCGKSADIDECIRCHQQMLEMLTPCHEDSIELLAASYRLLPDLSARSTAVDEYIRHRQELLEAATSPDRSRALQLLAASHRVRFDLSGARADIDDCIRCYEEVLETLEDDHIMVGVLETLFASYHLRFQSYANVEDLDQCIHHLWDYISLLEDLQGPDHWDLHYDLGDLLIERLELVPRVNDIDANVRCVKLYIELWDALEWEPGAGGSSFQELSNQRDIENYVEWLFGATCDIKNLDDEDSDHLLRLGEEIADKLQKLLKQRPQQNSQPWRRMTRTWIVASEDSDSECSYFRWMPKDDS